MKKLWLFAAVGSLGGCAAVFQPTDVESAPEQNQPADVEDIVVTEVDDFCLVDAQVSDFEYRCEPAYWVQQWVTASQTKWPVRKKQIAGLGNGMPDIFYKIILSLPTDTPYQDRLRAKHWLSELIPKLTPVMQTVSETLVSAPHDQGLEFESAMSLLSKVNTQQAQALEQLKEELAAQQEKMDELLKIEATLMDKNRSTQQ